MAQGNEGVFFFINNGESKFNTNPILRFPPVYEASEMQMIDFDGANDMDSIIANGDNGDYSHILKYYHGIHIFVNLGDFTFEQQYIYLMDGATRMKAADFDHDNDIDIMVTSFFQI